MRQLDVGRRLDDQHLRLVALLDADRADALELANALDRPVRDPEHLDLDDRALGDAGLEVGRRAVRDDLALRDHRDAVAEGVGLEHVVRGQQDGLPRLGERGDRGAQLAGADRVEPDRGLVEEDDRRVVQQPAGHVQALLHPPRVALDPLLLAPLQPDELEQLLDPGPDSLAGNAVELGEVAQVVEPREPLVDAALAAEDVADPLAHLRASLTTS